jgi:hypothetical protein
MDAQFFLAQTVESACETDGPLFFTGITLQGLELWAVPPNRYSHVLAFCLQTKEAFETIARKSDYQISGKDQFEVACPYPDNTGFTALYVGYSTLEEAEDRRERFNCKTHKLNVRLNVGYKTEGVWSTKSEGGTPWSIVLADGWPGLFRSLTPEEAELVLEYSELAQDEWQRRSQQWIDAENRRTELIAQACARDAINIPYVTELECFECGAVYEEPGHVEAGGMSCDRCN